MSRARKSISRSVDARDFLQRLVRRRKVARGEAQRAEIILRAVHAKIAEPLDSHSTSLTETPNLSRG